MFTDSSTSLRMTETARLLKHKRFCLETLMVKINPRHPRYLRLKS